MAVLCSRGSFMASASRYSDNNYWYGASLGKGWAFFRSYVNSVASLLITFLTVLRDSLNSLAICRNDFLSLWYAHRILRIVSTISISSGAPLRSFLDRVHYMLRWVNFRRRLPSKVGQFCMPINTLQSMGKCYPILFDFGIIN